MRQKTGEGQMGDDRNMVIEAEGIAFVKNVGGRQMLRFMRAGTSVCVMLEGVVFFGKFSLLVIKLECSRMDFSLVGIFIFRLSVDFVVVEVEAENLELVVECVMRLILGCLNRRTYFL